MSCSANAARPQPSQLQQFIELLLPSAGRYGMAFRMWNLAGEEGELKDGTAVLIEPEPASTCQTHGVEITFDSDEELVSIHAVPLF